MSEYAAMIFAHSAKEPHEPQPQTAGTTIANRTNRNRELHEPQPQTAAANRTNRSRKPHEPQPQTARTATEPHVLTYF